MVMSEQKRHTMASVTILQHIQCETPGIISQCLQNANIDMHLVGIFDGDPIPLNMDAQAGLIIMGGPMSVYDQAQFPFLLAEQRLIEKALEDNKPVLGVCLGSQLLAAVLGAEVKSGAQREIGWYPVALKESAATDSLWKHLPNRFMAYHWHGDAFDLPQGAVSLASSEMTPCQAFRYDKNAYGFLFHMEVTEHIIKNMVTEFQEELEDQRNSAASIIQTSRDYLPALQTIGVRVFRRWIRLLETI